jgi:cytochrome P450
VCAVPPINEYKIEARDCDASTAPRCASRVASVAVTTPTYDAHRSVRAERWLPYVRCMLDDLASSVDPYPVYAELRDRGVHRVEDGRWVVSRAADVAAVLAHRAAHVECPRSGDDRLDDVRALMARFSNGTDHARRRAVVADAVAALTSTNLGRRAEALASSTILAGEGVDVVALARHVVPIALADALGFADPIAVAASTSVFAAALAPRSDAPLPSKDAVDQAIDALLVAAPTAAGVEVAVNLVALLHQSLDATAGLVGSAVLATTRHGVDGVDVASLVREANRWDPPVQHTTRSAVAEITIGGRVIAPGERIVVLLAAANRDPVIFSAPDEFRPGRAEGGVGFGSGAHACPGESIALRLASGIVDAVDSAGLRSIRTNVRYERRSNLRIPADLVVAPTT